MGKKICGAVLVVVAVTVGCWGEDKDPRLVKVSTIYVEGNNQAAQAIRKKLRKGFKKGCLTLATKRTEADAILQINEGNQSMGGPTGGLGGRSSVVSGTLVTLDEEYLWDHSERFSDAPFMSGAKTAGGLLLHRLAKDAQCKKRKKK